MQADVIALERAEIEAITDLYQAARPDAVALAGLSFEDLGVARVTAASHVDHRRAGVLGDRRAAFQYPPSIAPLPGQTVGRPHWTHYLALDGGRPIGRGDVRGRGSGLVRLRGEAGAGARTRRADGARAPAAR
jgi:hypothetical protein